MPRLFVAIPLPCSFYGLFEPLLLKLSLLDVGKVVLPSELHITVHFCGEVRSCDIEELCSKIEKCLVGVKSFPVDLRGVGTFGGRVVWVSAFGSVLSSLFLKFGSAFFLFDHGGDTVPHVTLCRVKLGSTVSSDFLVKHVSDKFGSFVCDRVVLYESVLELTGANHRVIREFFLC